MCLRPGTGQQAVVHLGTPAAPCLLACTEVKQLAGGLAHRCAGEVGREQGHTPVGWGAAHAEGITWCQPACRAWELVAAVCTRSQKCCCPVAALAMPTGQSLVRLVGCGGQGSKNICWTKEMMRVGGVSIPACLA